MVKWTYGRLALDDARRALYLNVREVEQGLWGYSQESSP
jgi:hypothetical protein